MATVLATQQCSTEWLTLKMAFLLLLGTACRHSELQALDRSTKEFPGNWAWVDLLTLPDLWAKHETSYVDPYRPRV